jgi:hypothetical protein
MMRLFASYAEAYGTYQTPQGKQRANGVKMEIKSSARTVRETLTIDIWTDHLSGHKPLGIIPIQNGDVCEWGCIDVDRYDINLGEIATQLEKAKLPLVVCRSKSGGAHIYIFFSKPIDAGELQEKLREIAVSLGFGDCEIFPKQTTVLREKGDVGNWICAPYFAGDETARYSIKPGGQGRTLDEFLDYAEKLRVSPNEFLTVAASPAHDESLDGGPPCLQHLTTSGFPEGTRNNGLFALGTFCKKKFGDDWERVLEDYNRKFMQPPLNTEEVAAVVKSLRKKDYNYKCSDSPCVNHCNAIVCKTRRFGVGGGEEWPNLSGLSVLETDPPIWFLTVNGQRIELGTDELIMYRRFHKVCVERLYLCFSMLTEKVWAQQIGTLMKEVIKIEAPPEAGVKGQFLELLQEFLTNRHRAETREEIAEGKPWFDDEKRLYYFRLQDLHNHLIRNKFDEFGRNQIAAILREMGGNQYMVVRGKGMNTFCVEERHLDGKMSPASLPPSLREPI